MVLSWIDKTDPLIETGVDIPLASFPRHLLGESVGALIKHTKELS